MLGTVVEKVALQFRAARVPVVPKLYERAPAGAITRDEIVIEEHPDGGDQFGSAPAGGNPSNLLRHAVRVKVTIRALSTRGGRSMRDDREKAHDFLDAFTYALTQVVDETHKLVQWQGGGFTKPSGQDVGDRAGAEYVLELFILRGMPREVWSSSSAGTWGIASTAKVRSGGSPEEVACAPMVSEED